MNQRAIRLLLVLLLAALLCACGAQRTMPHGFTIGYSTPRGNQIWIRDAVFDESWQIPGGFVSCCWKEAGGTVSVNIGPMPGSVRVVWGDASRGVIYEARTDLPADLTEQALDLPPITLEMNGATYYDPMLIIGLRDSGEMVVWLANSTSGNNVKNFVIKVVGRAEGHVVRKVSPETGER